MKAWARSLAKLQADCPRFLVRVVEWGIDAPAVNMAILDGRVVFLALTGETIHRTGGIAVEAADVAAYFSAYYDNLWRASQPLADCIGAWDQSTTTAGIE